MLAYAGRRLAISLLVLVLASAGLFAALRLLPGDAAVLQAGLAATPAHAESEDAGDQVAAYLRWIGAVAGFDLGRSAIDGEDVGAALAARLPVTLELVALATAWVVGIGVPLGVLSAVRSGRGADLSLRVVMSLLLATPGFWLASLVLMLPQQWWSYAPPLDGARSPLEDPLVNLAQFVPASLVLAAPSMAGVFRITRTAVLATLGADFVRTAHAKGLRPALVLTRHVLRVAMPPVLSSLGVFVGGLLGGSVIIESIFNLNGVAQYFLRSVLQKDFAPAQAIALYVAAGVVLVNLLADTAHAVVDPRLRTPS